jgi:hypothetical protein
VLKAGADERVVRVSEPGSYVVVPKGAWHTARPHAPTTLLFVTPGEGTLNAEQPPEGLMSARELCGRGNLIFGRVLVRVGSGYVGRR